MLFLGVLSCRIWGLRCGWGVGALKFECISCCLFLCFKNIFEKNLKNYFFCFKLKQFGIFRSF
jgi:hypothetical protein